MYQHLLPTLKPLVFEGKSGILEVTHTSNDRAYFYLKEGIIEQVTTLALRGPKAVKACMGWVSITCTFFENKEGSYSPDPGIETSTILTYLEKVSKNIDVIQKKIPDNTIVLQIDSSKLNSTSTLDAKDLAIALLFDGKRSLEQVIADSGKSELAVLTHTCRLIMAGIAKIPVQKKDIMVEQEQNFFLHSLGETLIDLVGLAGPLLIDEAFTEIQCQPGMLNRDDLNSLVTAIGKTLDEDEREKLDLWCKAYLRGI